MDRSRTWVVESRHDLRLVSTGHKRRRVARIIAGFTGRTRREAMGMIETAPVLILQGANHATAEDARMALERLGATVEERAYEVETAGPPPQSSTPPTSRQTVWTIVGWGLLILVLLLIILVVVVSLIVASAGGGAARQARLPRPGGRSASCRPATARRRAGGGRESVSAPRWASRSPPIPRGPRAHPGNRPPGR